jgi:hypothetical protein
VAHAASNATIRIRCAFVVGEVIVVAMTADYTPSRQVRPSTIGRSTSMVVPWPGVETSLN